MHGWGIIDPQLPECMNTGFPKQRGNQQSTEAGFHCPRQRMERKAGQARQADRL
jgi:hypothetical protein